MQEHYLKVKDYLQELDFIIVTENIKQGILVVSREQEGIKNLILGVYTPILIIEQHLFNITTNDKNVYKSLLKKNRDIVHGAFVLDESGEKVIFRDTLRLQNLDLDEFEGSINSLSLLLSEFAEQIINYSKH
ncbi:molecular chaperone Tir [Croceivirga sp. JEA036]|uniref:molecular chaperone Tir n=1 Tax=Croceivirga sp. JEA036 TaxID=2721162 RepID=UPI00143A885D|nr:molecular chaperone Tir [Croceivirga sp. JEA036]NJB37672.1 molecular chaperone Tir [Croceivirga sp. JEA036]